MEEELQEQRRENQERVISEQVMHHSADPSTEAVHHQHRDRYDCTSRTSETKLMGFPVKRLMNITCCPLFSFAAWVRKNAEQENFISSFIRCRFSLLSSNTQPHPLTQNAPQQHVPQEKPFYLTNYTSNKAVFSI